MTERQKLPDLEPGQVIDGLFRIERKLGAGGMGGVYLARHATLGRTFALKTIAAIPGGVEMKTRYPRVRDQLILFIRNLGALYGRTGDIAQAMRYRAEADELEKSADSQ